MKKILPYIAIITAMIIWGSSGIATKIALSALSPLTLVTMRFSLSIILMLIIGICSKTLNRLDKKDIPLFLIAGFAQPFCYFILETYGLRLTSSPTIAEVILSTGPLFAPLLAFILIKEKVTWNNIIGIIISTLGVFLMLSFGNSNFSIGSSWGIVLLFLAVFSAVIYTVLLRKIPDKYNSLSTVFYVQLFSLLFFIPTFCISELPKLITAESFSLPDNIMSSVCAVLYLALFSSVIAFILFCYVVREIGVTKANAFNNIRPVFTAIIMLIGFNEQLPPLKWVAIIVVIVGLFVCQHEFSQKKTHNK